MRLKNKQSIRVLVALLIVIASSGFSVLLEHKIQGGENRTFEIQARQYAYDPPVIKINQGDTVHIRLSSMDVVHGFYLEGHGIDAEIYPSKVLIRLRDAGQKNGFREVEEIVFIADKVGKFRYRCSHTCGYLHPFMQGEFIVGPNYPLRAAIGAAIGVFIAAIVIFSTKGRKPEKATSSNEILRETKIG